MAETVEQRGPRGMTPEDITRIRWVSDPQLSPDGERVAFVVTVLSEAEDEYLANIWICGAAPGGEAPRRFTTGPLRDTAPRWSPDGRWLAFVSEREDRRRGAGGGASAGGGGSARPKGQLYAVPAAGGEARRLTTVEGGAKDPVWSPDGRHLAFLSRVGGPPEPEAEGERGVSKPARVITTLKYRLDNEGFTYDRRSHVFVLPFPADGPADGPPAAPRQVTDGDFEHSDPAWSPDGRRLAFCAARHQSRDLDNASDVWVVDLSGEGAGPPLCLTDTAGPVKQPVWSPDGRHVAYLGHPFPRESGRNLRLYTVPAAPDPAAPVSPSCLTEGFDRTCSPFFATSRPLWVTSGEGDGDHGAGWLLFAVESEGDVPVYRVPGDGAAPPERVIGGPRQVSGLSASPDGRRLAFCAADPVTPAEVSVFDTDPGGAPGGAERRLTDLNREWKGGVALSAPQRFRFQRAGVDLDVWVMRPAGAVPGRRYPALLNIHGGPATQYGHTFFDEFQVYAGAGYAVVFANPRGSQGYGEAFARAITGDWGNDDYADVMAALDEAVRRTDVIDPERLGVLGGSYGGYLTSWVVGHTDRFKAACSERALNDHASFYGTSDIGPLFGEDVSGGLPWERRDAYSERSPLTYAERITTPLIIMHAENDLRCPIGQAESLFAALKRLGRETVLVRFPDEGHELSRSGRPRHRLERFRILLDWFGRHLRP